MSDVLDEHLRKALARQPVLPGFSGRVMNRLPARLERPRWWYASIAAALVLALLFAGARQKQEQQGRRARDTERQVVFALALAIRKFEHVNARLQQSAPTVRVDDKLGERQTGEPL